MSTKDLETQRYDTTEVTGTLTLGGFDSLFGARADQDALSRRLFAHVCRAEGVRGRMLAVCGFATFAAFLPASFIFESRFQSMFGSEIPRIGISQILLGTSFYGLASAWLFRSRDTYASRSFQVMRYLNATIEGLMPSILLFGVIDLIQDPIAIASPPLLFYFIFIGLSALRFDFLLAIYTGTVAALGYLFVAKTALPNLWLPGSGTVLTEPLSHLERAAVIFACGIIAGAVAVQCRRLLRKVGNAHRDRERVRTVFGRHVSDVVADELLDRSTQIQDDREVVVLFLDIRNFTGFSENRAPKEVVDYLNKLFEEFIDTIELHQGFVNKFLGDGLMAVFGAPLDDPDAAEHACLAAEELDMRVKALVARSTIPPTSISIGLHMGLAITGTVGTESRQEYTVIGDTVNTAARIEALNRQFETTILISEAVKDAAPLAADLARPLGPVSVKGKEQTILVYSLDR